MDESKAAKIIDLPHTIKLADPFQLGQTDYDEITFKRKPRAKSLGLIPADESRMLLGHFFPLIADMTGLPPVVIDELSPDDLNRCNEVAMYFFRSTRETGDSQGEQ